MSVFLHQGETVAYIITKQWETLLWRKDWLTSTFSFPCSDSDLQNRLGVTPSNLAEKVTKSNKYLYYNGKTQKMSGRAMWLCVIPHLNMTESIACHSWVNIKFTKIAWTLGSRVGYEKESQEK